MAIMGHQIGKALIDALGLPPKTISFTLHVESGSVVTAKCEYCVPDGDGLVKALAEYELIMPVKAVYGPRIKGTITRNFDAWMRERTDASHAAYMARHAAGGIAYN